MPKYLVHGNYFGEGVKGLLAEGGSSRKAVIEKLANSMGGSLESAYYAFGETDIYMIFDMPDDLSMAAVALIANASGSARVKTTVLLSPEEVDEAVKKTPNYRPPGSKVSPLLDKKASKLQFGRFFYITPSGMWSMMVSKVTMP